MSTNVFVKSGRVTDILPNTTTNLTGSWLFKDAPKAAIQAVVFGSGAITATINIEVSNDGVYACATVLGTITLSGSNLVSDGFTSDAPWKFIRAVTSNVTGTGATVYVKMSV